MAATENASRHAAMAIGCAFESRTSGPANDMPMTARRRTSAGLMERGVGGATATADPM